MLLDKTKDKQATNKPEESQVPQAVAIIDSSEIQKKLEEEAKKEERKRKQLEAERKLRRQCGCW